MADESKCELCGEPMPPGETMFKFHGYSGPCPKPPLPKETPPDAVEACRAMAAVLQGFTASDLVNRAKDIHGPAFDEAHEKLWAVVNYAAKK